MNKQDVISFFDRYAPGWDDGMIRNEEIISAILDNGGIKAGIHVLDVACGTGVLFPDYLNRGAASVIKRKLRRRCRILPSTRYDTFKVVLSCLKS